MKSYSSREVIAILKKDGWYEVACVDDHHQFKHPTKKGRVTVTHPRKDIPIKTLQSISKQSGSYVPVTPLHHNGGICYVERSLFLRCCVFI